MSILIQTPGLLTTVQDLGCTGYQKYGVPPAGAMDTRSFSLANLLVGNDGGDAGLEITILGPCMQFEESAVIAVTGGDLQPVLNGAPLSMYRALAVQAGDTVQFLGPKTGCRAYMAFAGGIDVPVVMGTRSTLLKSGIGGYKGRALLKGDRLQLLKTVTALPGMPQRCLAPEDFSAKEITVRVVEGPQAASFSKQGMQTFLGTPYTVGKLFDRLGYRLEGAEIEHDGEAGIISDGIAFGSIQVPADGQPIILMADRQSTGGYTKIAAVISVDLPLVAQCVSGCRLRFQMVSIEQAQQLYRQEFAGRQRMREQLEAVAPQPVGSERRFEMQINGEAFTVRVQQIQ